jgi:hypothetical protein
MTYNYNPNIRELENEPFVQKSLRLYPKTTDLWLRYCLTYYDFSLFNFIFCEGLSSCRQFYMRESDEFKGKHTFNVIFNALHTCLNYCGEQRMKVVPTIMSRQRVGMLSRVRELEISDYIPEFIIGEDGVIEEEVMAPIQELYYTQPPTDSIQHRTEYRLSYLEVLQMKPVPGVTLGSYTDRLYEKFVIVDKDAAKNCDPGIKARIGIISEKIKKKWNQFEKKLDSNLKELTTIKAVKRSKFAKAAVNSKIDSASVELKNHYSALSSMNAQDYDSYYSKLPKSKGVILPNLSSYEKKFKEDIATLKSKLSDTDKKITDAKAFSSSTAKVNPQLAKYDDWKIDLIKDKYGRVIVPKSRLPEVTKLFSEAGRISQKDFLDKNERRLKILKNGENVLAAYSSPADLAFINFIKDNLREKGSWNNRMGHYYPKYKSNGGVRELYDMMRDVLHLLPALNVGGLSLREELEYLKEEPGPDYKVKEVVEGLKDQDVVNTELSVLEAQKSQLLLEIKLLEEEMAKTMKKVEFDFDDAYNYAKMEALVKEKAIEIQSMCDACTMYGNMEKLGNKIKVEKPIIAKSKSDLINYVKNLPYEQKVDSLKYGSPTAYKCISSFAGIDVPTYYVAWKTMGNSHFWFSVHESYFDKRLCKSLYLRILIAMFKHDLNLPMYSSKRYEKPARKTNKANVDYDLDETWRPNNFAVNYNKYLYKKIIQDNSSYSVAARMHLEPLKKVEYAIGAFDDNDDHFMEYDHTEEIEHLAMTREIPSSKYLINMPDVDLCPEDRYQRLVHKVRLHNSILNNVNIIRYKIGQRRFAKGFLLPQSSVLRIDF